MTSRQIPYFSPGKVFGPCKELAAAGWTMRTFASVNEVASFVSMNKVHAGIMDFPDFTPFPVEAIEEVILADRTVEWLALVATRHLSSPGIARLIAENFHNFHIRPVDEARLLVTLANAYEMGLLRSNMQQRARCTVIDSIIGESAVMRELCRDMSKMQHDDAPILITGESGTGKEVVARAIHSGSPRSRSPFIAVNCGAIPAALIQSELYGHEKGAFTDAYQRKIGRFEAAEQGTILLDEIGDLALPSQVNLLRFLQEKSIERVGSGSVIPVDVRVIAATNIDLESAVKEGRFREDLFYRLNVLRLRLPPLRARGRDVELLAQAFLDRFCESCGKKSKRLSAKAVRALYDHPWPGNIRELINRVRHAVVMSEGRLITPADLGLEELEIPECLTLEQVRETAELAAVRKSLERNRNNVSEAARQLGVSRVTLYRLIKKLKADPAFAAWHFNY